MSKVVPEGWEQKNIGELVTLKYGKSPKEILSKTGNYPVIGTGGITGYSSSFLHEGGTTVIGRKGSINNPSYIEGPFWAIDTTYYSDNYKGVDPKWFYYSLKAIDLMRYNEASGVPSLNRDTLCAIPLLKPPFAEQQKIATILSSVDNVIEKTRTQIDKLKDLKTGMMQELLTKGIGHTEFKDSPVGRIPKEWKVVQFKDVFTLNYGKTPKDIVAENGVNTVWGTGGETAKTNNFLYEGESIVLGRKGTIDQPRYVTGKFWVIDTAYYSSNHGENNIRFLYYTLQIKNLKALNEASGVPSLSRDTLYAEWLVLPDPIEQQAIAKILYAIEVKIAVTNKKLSGFEKNKKALMQDLLTGKKLVESKDN